MRPGTDVDPAAYAVTVVDCAGRLESTSALRHQYGLTPGQANCADLIREGLSVAEVAAALGIARATVRAHLQSLFRKTGTHRQGELVSRLQRNLQAFGRRPTKGDGR